MQIVIVGGGVVGLASAVALLDDGHCVTVYAPRDPDAPSWNNAGHLATEQVVPLASIDTIRALRRRHILAGGALDLPLRQAGSWMPFALRLLTAARPARHAAGRRALTELLHGALLAWRRLATALGDEELVRSDGHLIVWDTAQSARNGRIAWEAADTGTAAIADPAPGDVALVHRLLGRDPGSSAVARFTGTAAIRDLTQLATALRARIAASGGELIERHATLTRERGRVLVDCASAEAVVVAAGVHSRDLLRPLGHKVPMIAERGYHIRAAAPDSWPEEAPPIVFEDRSMIVTRYADSVQAASFVEFGRVGAPPDPRKWARLERHVAALGLPLRPPFTRWIGARPTLPDYLPAIGRSSRADNLFYAFGHQHLGLTLAPVTAAAVAALVAGRAPGIDLTPFALDRF